MTTLPIDWFVHLPSFSSHTLTFIIQQEDVPTGLTPQKRDLELPEEFPVTRYYGHIVYDLHQSSHFHEVVAKEGQDALSPAVYPDPNSGTPVEVALPLPRTVPSTPQEKIWKAKPLPPAPEDFQVPVIIGESAVTPAAVPESADSFAAPGSES